MVESYPKGGLADGTCRQSVGRYDLLLLCLCLIGVTLLIPGVIESALG